MKKTEYVDTSKFMKIISPINCCKMYLCNILSLVLILLMSFSCQKERKYNIGVSMYHVFSWREKLAKEIMYSSYQYDDLSLNVVSAQNNGNLQAKQLRKMIRNKVDLLIVSPIVNSNVANVLDSAFRMDIPIVIVDNKAAVKNYTAFIGADNYSIGKTIGKYSLNQLGESKNIIEIQGKNGDLATIERHKGFVDALKENQKAKLVASVYGNWIDTIAQRKVKESISYNKAVDLVFFHSDGMVNLATSMMLKDYSKYIKVISIDATSENPSGIQNIKNGMLTASFIYPTRGDKVLELAMKILKHKPFVKDETLPTGILDKTNLETVAQQHVEIGALDSLIDNMMGQIKAIKNRQREQQTVVVVMTLLLLGMLSMAILVLRAYKKNRELKRHLEEQYILKEQQANQLLVGNKKLMQLNKKIEEEVETKMNFFTNISHEIRTPLTLVAGPLETLDASISSMNEQQGKLIKVANHNAKILLNLVNDILDFRKVQTGNMEMKLELFNLTSAVKDWTDNFRNLATTKNIQLTLLEDDRHPINIQADRMKITSIFVNLLGNAFKYTPDFGTISVTLIDMEENVCLKIQDNGKGIADEEQKRIFEKFYQSASSQGGTGIGLTLVKSFVDLHKGTIYVSSALGIGALFTVTLPKMQKPIEEINTAETETEEVEILSENAAGMASVLIIDDSEDMRNYIDTILSSKYLVRQACDGKKGLEIATETCPDIIVCDVMMPIMDGLTCCSKLKENLATSHIPVILLTARSISDNYVEGYNSGADAYITKPFEANVLLSRIENLLNSRILLRRLFGKDEKQFEEMSKPRESIFVNRFKEYMEENLADSELSVEMMAEHMCLSRSQFYAKIKSLTGISPIEHLKLARLKRSCDLLLTTDKSISDIAYIAGFTAPSYFSKCFKDEYKKSPNEYRNQPV